MRHYFLPALLFCFLLLSCRKAEELRYSTHDNIYFDFDPETKDRDSIVYTFAYEPARASDTILLPVRISGNRVPVARTFKVSIQPQGTTAQAGLHYEALKESYTLPADSGTFSLPIILLNTDPELTQKSVTL
ncbi:MAG TPA: DUF4843 domain-containing protein, partial [Chitinophagaceae bacterium]|nr:DUF4843 domain-containing protein [Chitinophagaceae bacterium]